MATKPTFKPLWGVNDTTLPTAGGPNKIRPTTGIRNTGLDLDSDVNAEELNWQFDNINEWVDWAEESIDDLEDASVATDASVTSEAATRLAADNALDGRIDKLERNNTATVSITVAGNTATSITVAVQTPTGAYFPSGTITKTTGTWIAGNGNGGRHSALADVADTPLLIWGLRSSVGIFDVILTSSSVSLATVLSATSASAAIKLAKIHGHVTANTLPGLEFKDGTLIYVNGDGFPLFNTGTTPVSMPAATALINAADLKVSSPVQESYANFLTNREFVVEHGIDIYVDPTGNSNDSIYFSLQDNANSAIYRKGGAIVFAPADLPVSVHMKLRTNKTTQQHDMAISRSITTGSFLFTGVISSYSILNYQSVVLDDLTYRL